MGDEFSGLIDRATESCHDRSPATRAVAKVELERYCAMLDQADPWKGYGHIPCAVQVAWLHQAGGLGETGLHDLLRLLIVRLIAGFESRFPKSGIPPTLFPEFIGVFRRMLKSIADGLFDAQPESHVFLKDLAIARLRMIPCASHVVYRHSGIPRRSLVLQPPRRFPEIIGFVRGLGGFKPFLENHVHPAMLDEFNAAGRARCYRLVADLLRAWPESKGLLGASWYYDPRVADISPNLGYLYEEPARHGALMLHVADEGADSGALARSRHRRSLYEAGAYRPKTYLMIWSRDDILRFTAQ